jgi:hypothetical protein
MPKIKGRRMATGKRLQKPAIQDLLAPIVAFLRSSGMRPNKIMSEWQTAIRRTSKHKPRLKVVRIGYEHLDSTVIARWLRDPTYLNRVGKPADLPLTGKVSLSSLVKICRVRVLPTQVARRLAEFGSVKEVSPGKYRLVRPHLNFTNPEILPFEPNFQFLVDAVRASTWGSAAQGNEPRLFWQNAIHTSVAQRHVTEFLTFARERGLIFAHEMDDWLEAHNNDASNSASKVPSNRKRLGVGLFGICSDAN